jgi:hypothetical protein
MESNSSKNLFKLGLRRNAKVDFKVDINIYAI